MKLDEPMEAEDHTVAEAGPDGRGEAESVLEVSKGWLSVVPISFLDTWHGSHKGVLPLGMAYGVLRLFFFTCTVRKSKPCGRAL